MPQQRQQRVGVTLIEMLIACAVISMVSIATAGIMGNARALRERGKHRAELALLAQGELDKLCAQPQRWRKIGKFAQPTPGQPANVVVTDEVARRADEAAAGTIELAVTAVRHSPAGDLQVRLVTLQRSAAP